jgi:hypothetical protein
MRIDIRTIPHSEQRYPSAGDWWWDSAWLILNIRVSRMSNPRYEFCLAVHELVEAMLCYFANVPSEAVDGFDFAYEEAHARGDSHYPCGCPRQQYSMPGDDVHSPYRREHRLADLFDYGLAAIMGLDRDDYDAQVDKPTP